MILQLRYLQTLSSIAAENNSTIPVPIDIISNMPNMAKPGNQMIDSDKKKCNAL
jgi:hypothetical protein